MHELKHGASRFWPGSPHFDLLAQFVMLETRYVPAIYWDRAFNLISRARDRQINLIDQIKD
jgi:hypothetical protein